MFINDIICDIYVGKGAGKKLLYDIRNATKSVKIVSPYLSPYLITELIKLNEKGIHIELITTNDIEDYWDKHDKNILKLIIQNRTVDENAQEKREKLKKYAKILLHIISILTTILIIVLYFNQSLYVLLGVLPIIILFSTYRGLKQKIEKMKIYNYWYSQLFPFKVYLSPENDFDSDTFIYSKIYLMDDRIAYLGSLNFTGSGTKNNYETRIRTTDNKAIEEIETEIDNLMNHTDLPNLDIQYWGELLYDEPIN